MATKKAKRARMQEKRARFEEEVRREGLEALQKSREDRLNKRREKARPKHEESHSWKKRDLDCILCVEEIKETERRRREFLRDAETDEAIVVA
jgi:hypothetical protein